MKHLELFAGIGGFRRAMDLLSKDNVMEFNCVGFSEIDPIAEKTYRANYTIDANEIVIGDIITFTKNKKNIKSLPKFDLLTGGFPCQTFSMMGNKAGFNEDRGQMFFRIMDILRIKKPKYILLENVKNLLNHDKGKTFNRIKIELESIGYKVYSDIFNTANFHLPQTRNRAFIFATKVKVSPTFQFSAKLISEEFEKKYKETSLQYYSSINEILVQEVDSKYFLSDRIKPTLLSNGSANFKSKSDINMRIARPLTATMHKMHRACQDNYYSQDFIISLGKIDPVKTMSKEELATLPIRKLIPEEAFMLQGFPSEFVEKVRRFGIADGSLYKQAGNAVSVNVVYAILYYLINNKIIK